MKPLCLFALAVVVIIPAPVRGQCPVSFASPVNYSAGQNPYSVAIGDLNGDAKPDLAVTNDNSNTVSVLIGNGDGTFQGAVNYIVGTGPSHVAIGDLNGDAKLDLAVTNSFGGTLVSLLLGNGDGTFQSAVTLVSGIRGTNSVIVDLNADSVPDLAVAQNTHGGSNVFVLIGSGGGTFQAPVSYTAGDLPAFVAIRDLNGDIKPDLTVTNEEGIVSVFLGNGDGTFQAALNYGTGGPAGAHAIGDFNGDSLPDLVVANSNNNVSVLLGSGNGAFPTAVGYAAGSGTTRFVTIGDVNSDGRPDLAVANFGSINVSVLLGNADGTFQSAIFCGANDPISVAIGNVNSDGRPDMVVANRGSSNVSVLINQSPVCGPDCNNNGISDACDISCGTPGGVCDVAGCGQSQDCNNNGVPDECDFNPEWMLRASTGPSPRDAHAMAYDTTRLLTVLFGGNQGNSLSDDTWEWNGSIWAQRPTPSGPSARNEHAMAYDSARGVTVLFGGVGGGYKGDTWEWNGTAWTLRATNGPPPRHYHSMAYDSARGVTVLFGGRDGGGSKSDTWEWNGSIWQLRSANGPDARSEHAMAYDAGRGVTVLFGGRDGGVYKNDTWEWNGSGWTQRLVTGPSLRSQHAMAYDVVRSVTLLYGGEDGFISNGETWEWNGTAWALRAVTGPSSRRLHAIAYDAARGETVLFGGWDGAFNDETWAYDLTSGVPQELAKLLASDAAENDRFSISVAVSGDTAVVGAFNDDHAGGADAGSAYIFVRNAGVWSQQAKLTASDASSGDFFGRSVAISGDTVVIGTVYAESAYVFVRSGGVWTQQAKLIASDPAGGDNFGVRVAISGDTAVIGSYHDDHAAGIDAGSAYVFVRAGIIWTQQAKLIASDAEASDWFGETVALSGDTAVIGTLLDDNAGGSNAGSAYVFVRAGTAWAQQAKLTAVDAAANDWFGNSVDVSGNTVVVGAIYDDNPGGIDAGSAYVFVREGTTWTQQVKLTASDATADDNFGIAAAISDNTVLVGAHANDSAGGNAGSAYVFVRSGGVWTEQAQLIASDAATGDGFGYSVSLSDDFVVVGAQGYDDAGSDTGSAYVFRLPSADCNNNGIPDECESNLGPAFSCQPSPQAICLGGTAQFTVCATGSGTLTYQWNKNAIPLNACVGNFVGCTSATLTINPVGAGDAGMYSVTVTDSCGSSTSQDASLTIATRVPPLHYILSTLCSSTAITAVNLISFSDDGLASNYECKGERCFRLFAGQACAGNCKIWRIKPTRQGCLPAIPGCTPQQFGPVLCAPESILVDESGILPGACGVPNQIVVGGCDTLYFLNPANGAICQSFPDSAFGHIGQMAVDSVGNLYVGSVDGDCLNVLGGGVLMPFYCCPGGSPRAVAVDENDNVYVTCAVDGVMRKLASDGTVINANFATGLQGAISQAIAPYGIFHNSIYVGCNDRVMEVDLAMGGAASMFLPCVGAAGIAFDPEGYLNVSVPTENLIHRIGSGLPGDMNGDGMVTLVDLPGFVAALLLLPDAPLPIVTADMNADGCTNGLDIRPFMTVLGV